MSSGHGWEHVSSGQGWVQVMDGNRSDISSGQARAQVKDGQNVSMHNEWVLFRSRPGVQDT